MLWFSVWYWSFWILSSEAMLVILYSSNTCWMFHLSSLAQTNSLNLLLLAVLQWWSMIRRKPEICTITIVAPRMETQSLACPQVAAKAIWEDSQCWETALWVIYAPRLENKDIMWSPQWFLPSSIFNGFQRLPAFCAFTLLLWRDNLPTMATKLGGLGLDRASASATVRRTVPERLVPTSCCWPAKWCDGFRSSEHWDWLSADRFFYSFFHQLCSSEPDSPCLFCRNTGTSMALESKPSTEDFILSSLAKRHDVNSLLAVRMSNLADQLSNSKLTDRHSCWQIINWTTHPVFRSAPIVRSCSHKATEQWKPYGAISRFHAWLKYVSETPG